MNDGLRQGRHNKQLVYYAVDLARPSTEDTLVAVFFQEADAARYVELFNAHSPTRDEKP